MDQQQQDQEQTNNEKEIKESGVKTVVESKQQMKEKEEEQIDQQQIEQQQQQSVELNDVETQQTELKELPKQDQEEEKNSESEQKIEQIPHDDEKQDDFKHESGQKQENIINSEEKKEQQTEQEKTITGEATIGESETKIQQIGHNDEKQDDCKEESPNPKQEKTINSEETKEQETQQEKPITQENIMQIAISERKKDAWNLLKEWDKQRVGFLTLHLQIISFFENLFKYLDEYSQASQQIISTLLEYFKGRSQQEIAYKQQNVELSINFDSLNQQQDFFKGLQKVNEQQKEKAEQCGKFGELLQQKAVSVLIQELQIMSQTLSVQRGKIIHSKQQLNTYFHKLSAKEIQLLNYQKSPQLDLFIHVAKWLKATEKVKEQQRILAKDICKFQIIIEEMKKRRETMLNQIIEDVFNNKVEKQQPTGIILNEVFNEEQLVFVKGWIGKEVQWQELNVFFEEFSIKEVGIEQYLLLKKIKVIGKEYQFVVVTVDGSILCILPSNKLKVLAHVTLAKAIRKQSIVEIDILQEGFFWNKVEKLSFTLENLDTAEEFIEVIEHAKHLLVQNAKN